MPRALTGRDYPSTSHEAAASIAAEVGTMRRRVLDAIRDAGAAGLTADEIEVRLGMPGNTCRPRLVELREAGLVMRTDRVRRTRSNRNALVYVASEGGSHER